MKRPLRLCLLGIAVLAGATKPLSARSPEEVQALVERAALYIHEHGQKQAFADFSRPNGGFVDGELFVFCSDAANIVLANGGNPLLVGKDLSAVRDAEGRLPARTLFRIAETQGRGWYEYDWPNPVSGRVERKFTYAARIDDETICASGYYRPDQP